MKIQKQQGIVVGVSHVLDYPVNEGALCPRGNTAYQLIQREDRLTHPLIREGDGFREASWGEALDLAAKRIKSVVERYGTKAVAVFGSTKITSEEAYLLQKLAREAIGTPNIDCGARMCLAPALIALREAIGFPYAWVELSQLEQADCILVMGANPIETSPVISRRILRAREAGAKVVVVDPRRSRTSWKSTIHLQVFPGRDAALVMAMVHSVLEAKLYSESAKELVDDLEKLERAAQRFAPEAVEEAVGVDAQTIRRVAAEIALSKKVAAIASHGVLQHVGSVEAVKALIYLLAVVRGFENGLPRMLLLPDQCNAFGVCEAGCLAEFGPGMEPVESPGLSMCEVVEAIEQGEVKALYIVGCNPVASLPHTQRVREALSSLEFLAVQDVFMTETAEMAHVVLPSSCWAETEGTFVNCELRVQRVSKVVEPPGEVMEGWRIVAELGRRIGGADLFPYTMWTEVLLELSRRSRVFNKVSVKDLAQLGGICALAEAKLVSRKVAVTPVEASVSKHEGVVLTTAKLLHHHGTGVFTRKIGFLMEEEGHPFLEISKADAEKLGVSDGDLVRVRSEVGSLEVGVRVTGIREGVVSLSPHFPLQSPNHIIPIKLDPKTKCPELKAVSVELERV